MGRLVENHERCDNRMETEGMHGLQISNRSSLILAGEPTVCEAEMVGDQTRLNSTRSQSFVNLMSHHIDL